CAHHPLQLIGREVELPLDGGQGHVDDREVQNTYELGGRQQCKNRNTSTLHGRLPHVACTTEAWPCRLEPPGDDALGVDANGRLRFRESLRAAADLDATRLPGRQHVVYDDGRTAAASDVPVFLGRREVMPAHVDGVEVCVVCPADGHDMGRAIPAHCCDAGQPALPAQIRQLLRSEPAHHTCCRRSI